MSELPPLRDLLESDGLWANKGLGQHFLLDLNITRRIARTANVNAGDVVLEVGPGPGGLTRALLEVGARVIAIEKDARFLPLLEPLIAWSDGRLELVHGDALEADEAALFHGPQPAQIVANLPYNIATPLLIKWLKTGSWRGSMTLMFQKEVAERIVAKPGDDAYGRLAVITQARCAAKIVFTVPAGAFTPAPKVASAVVSFANLADPYRHLDALERVTAAAFGQRRKMLRSALKALTPDAESLLRDAGLEPTARAEEIDQAGFRKLAETWRARNAR